MKLLNNLENHIFEKYFNLKMNSLIKKDFEPNGYKYFRTPKGIKKWGNNYNSYFEKIRELQNNILASEKQIQELEIDMVLNFDIKIYSKKMNVKTNKFR